MRTRAALVVTALLLGALAAHAADPFYERQLSDGVRELARGDADAAARDLRIAAFGLLDEPVRLAEALVPLAMAQAALGDGLAFIDTFGRIAVIEERFGAYDQAKIPDEMRRTFAERAAALIPADTLARSPAFRDIAQAKREAQIASLPKRERRQRVEALAAAEPDEPRWLLLLGRLELEDRNRDRAAELATRVLALLPQDQRALCLRGLARAEAEQCAEAIPDLEACQDTRANPAVARLLLDCYAGLERWSEASRYLEQLAPKVRADRTLEKVQRRILRQEPEAPVPTGVAEPGTETGAGPPAEAPAAVPPPSDTPAAAPPPAAELTDADREALSRARALLRQAKVADDLDDASRVARDVADRNPGAAQAQLLAGEIAYRASRWQEAVRYFNRAGTDDDRAEIAFYMAVSLYRTGDAAMAKQALERALPRLRRTPFVETLIREIMASPEAPREAPQ